MSHTCYSRVFSSPTRLLAMLESTTEAPHLQVAKQGNHPFLIIVIITPHHSIVGYGGRQWYGQLSFLFLASTPAFVTGSTAYKQQTVGLGMRLMQWKSLHEFFISCVHAKCMPRWWTTAHILILLYISASVCLCVCLSTISTCAKLRHCVTMPV